MNLRRASLFAIGSSFALGFACSDEASTTGVDIGDASIVYADSGPVVGDDDATTDATSASDSSASSDSSANEDASLITDGSSTVGDADAAESAPPATLLSLSLVSITEGTSDTLCATATGLLPAARLYFNGAILPVVVPDGGSMAPDAGDGGNALPQICATLAVATNSPAGKIPVYIENTPGDSATRSNSLTLDVHAANGFRIVDIQPDNGNVGDKVRILGENLPASFTITDSTGVISATLSTVDGGGTMDWPGGALQYAELVIPANWHTGATTFSNGANSYRGPVFNVGTNLSTTASVSTNGDYGGWPFSKAVDNDLATSWFAALDRCATEMCSQPPIAEIEFAAPKMIGRVAIRGNREYSAGYDFKRVRIEIRGAKPADAGAVDGGDAGSVLGPLLATRDVALSTPMADGDVSISPAVSGSSVRFISLEDESTEPGLAEIEVFEN